jgi:hypothetical protein
MPIQPYPSGGGDQVGAPMVGSPVIEPAPQSVLNAVKLMYAGAALSVVSLIAIAFSAGSIRSRLEKNHPMIKGKPATPTQITGLVHFDIAFAIFFGVIGVVLWLLMARKNGQGRPWARIVSSVLFVFSTLSLLSLRSGGQSPFYVVLGLLSWLVGVGAVVFLWLPASSRFFVTQRR